MRVAILKRIHNIAYTPIIDILSMIKSPDDTKTGHSQSHCVTKKITPKISEDMFTHFIQAVITNGGQGGKGGACQGVKLVLKGQVSPTHFQIYFL